MTYARNDDRRRTLDSRIQQRRHQLYVGRSEELALFEDNLRLPPEDDRRSFIFSVSGQGGVGKSSLLDRFADQAARSGAATVLLNERQDDILSSIITACSQLTKQDYDVRTVLDRYRTYTERRGQLEADPESHSFATFLGKTAGRTSVVLARRVPIAGTVADFVDEDAVADQAGRFASFIARKLSDRDERTLLLDPVTVLTGLLLTSLMHNEKSRPVVLMIDTYEKTGVYLDSWLRGIIDGQYGEVIEDIIITIAGRDELDRNNWDRYDPVIRRIALSPFSEAEAREYLTVRGVKEEATFNEILELSGRLPLLLATLTAGRGYEAGPMPDASRTAIARFLKWTAEPEFRDVALNASLPRWLNRDVISVLVGEADAEARFSWLQSMPFVQDTREGWIYHDVVRSQMLRLKRREAPSEWTDLHGRLAAYFDALASPAIAGIDSKAAPSSIASGSIDGAYHRLCQSPQQTLTTVIDMYFAAPDQPARSRYARVLIDAGTDCGSEYVQAAGSLLTELARLQPMKASEQEAEVLSTLLDNYKLESVARIAALHRRGAVYQGLDRIERALADFHAAHTIVQSALNHPNHVAPELLTEAAAAEEHRAILLRRQGDLPTFVSAAEDFIVSIGCVIDSTRVESVLADQQSAQNSTERDSVAAVSEMLTMSLIGVGKVENTNRLLYAYLAQTAALNDLGRRDVALRRYKHLTARLSDQADEELRDLQARTMSDYGDVLVEDGHPREAVAVYSQVVKLDPGDQSPAIRIKVAHACYCCGLIYHDLEEHERAIEYYRQCIAAASPPEQVRQRALTARSLCNIGGALSDSDRDEEAIAAYDEAIHQFGADSDPGLREPVARSLCKKGNSLETLGRTDEAVAAYAETVRKFVDDVGPDLFEPVVIALDRLVTLRPTPDVIEQATADVQKVWRRLGEQDASVANVRLASTMNSLGLTLTNVGQYEKALELFDRILERRPELEDDSDVLVFALCNRAVALAYVGMFDEARAAFDVLTSVCERRVEPESRAAAEYSRAYVLGKLGDEAGARAILREIDDRYPGGRHDSLRARVMHAIEAPVRRVGDIGRP